MPTKQVKVVLVDDDQHVMVVLRSFLKKHGCEVMAEATTTEEALAIVSSLKDVTAVVVLDGNLHVHSKNCTDGLRVIKELKARTKAVKIIGYSGEYVECFTSKCDRFVSKGPGSIRQILLAIQELASELQESSA